MDRQIDAKKALTQNQNQYPVQVRDTNLQIKFIYQLRIFRNPTFFGQSVSAYQLLL